MVKQRTMNSNLCEVMPSASVDRHQHFGVTSSFAFLLSRRQKCFEDRVCEGIHNGGAKSSELHSATQHKTCTYVLLWIDVHNACGFMEGTIEWMNGWMNEWMNDGFMEDTIEWMNKWMNDGFMEGTIEWMTEWWTYGRHDWMNEWMNEWWIYGRHDWMNEWMMDLWKARFNEWMD
jgi:hypothetical protein